ASAEGLRMEGQIGRGGMGAVLRARDLALNREVAVKVLLAKHARSAELAQRFLEEAQIAGQLQHPGVVPVYELGKLSDQRPYFTLKLVKGSTLDELLKDAQKVESGSNVSLESRASWLFDPQGLPRFLKIFEQVCQAIAYAHSRRVIHRDLKPSNIMVGKFGEV